jgi:uncharacterized membrane protein required for colicin V production
MANIIIDGIIVILLLLGAFLGFKLGFFYTATKPIKWFAAILLAFSLSSTVATSFVQPMIEEPITNQVSDFLTEKCKELTPDNAKEKLPTLVKVAAGIADIDINSIEGETIDEFISATVDKLANPLIHLISVIISFFAVYFISKLALAIILAILNRIFLEGVLGVFNKMLGLVVGFFFAFVILWLGVTLFDYVISIPKLAETEFVKSFGGGFIYKFIKSMSPLDLLLSF